MQVWRFVILTAILVALTCPKAGSQTLAPKQIFEIRRSSVVFFRTKVDTETIGYGVLVSKQGHVLTAKHVIDRFGEKEPIRATIGSKDSVALLEFEDDRPSMAGLDVSVLKIKNPAPDLRPAPIGKADHFREGSTKLEILTGFIDQKTSTPLSAMVSSNLDAKPDLWRMQGAGIDQGHSGSPAFDQFGNVVGFVPEGFAGKGIFNLRTFDSIAVWLKHINVPIEERVKPIKFVAYVRAIGHETVRIRLQQKLTEMIERWLGAKRSANATDPPFLKDLMLRWDEPLDTALEAAANGLGTAWLDTHDSKKLYLYFVNLEFAGSNDFPTSAKQLLIVLEKVNGTYEARQTNLNPATFQAPRADGGPSAERRAFSDGASSLLRAAADTDGAPFRESNIIFAECLRVKVPDPLASQISKWKADAAQKFTSELRKTWSNHPVRHQYRLSSSAPQGCGDLLFGTSEEIEQMDQQQSEMAELVIRSTVSGAGAGAANNVTIDWQLQRSRPIAQVRGPQLQVNLVGDNFAAGLANSIATSWDKLLDDLKHQ